MVSGVYEIRNLITRDCYIGSSMNLLQRKKRHFKDLKNNLHHSIILQRAYYKYGEAAFKFSVIEFVEDIDTLISREQYYLETVRPKYNIYPTAGSSLGYKQSKESCMKKREYAINNNIYANIKNYYLEKQKEVIMLDYDTLTPLNKFISASAAARYLGRDCTCASTITSCCKNKRFSAYGYRWVFKEDDIKNLRCKIKTVSWNKGKKVGNKLSKKVKQFDLNMNFIKEWESVKDAENFFGKGISNCATGKSKTSNGYIWKY